MMRVSTKGRYALRVMLDLALHRHEGSVTVKEMAQRQNITPRYMEAIISLLLKAGLVASNRGKMGGYRLVKEPVDYTLLEIIEAAEGSLAPVDCLSLPENDCPIKGNCATLPVWVGLEKLIEDYFRGISLNDLIQNSKEFSLGSGI